MSKGLSVSDVVKVTINLQPKATQRRNFGVHLILGASTVIDQDERIRFYSGIDGIIADFGIFANESKLAIAYYDQTPKPSTLAVGRWVREDAPARLKGGILPPANMILTGTDGWQSITNGGFNIIIDGTEVEITGLDFSLETNLNGVARVISEKLAPAADCVWDGSRFTIQTTSSGAGATIGYATSSVGQGATDIAYRAGLDESQALPPIAGAKGETALESVATHLDISSDWYGLLPAEPLTVAEHMDIAALIEGQDESTARVYGVTITDTRVRNAEYQQDLGALLKPMGFNRTFLQHSTNIAAASSAFARTASVNFADINSTITLKFKKQPGIAFETLKKSEAKALADKNVNVFVVYQNDEAILQEGVMSGGAFLDEIHGLDWLQNAIQTAVWNHAAQTGKVGQDDDSMNVVVTVVEKVLEEAKKNGLIAPGTWNAEGFGQLSQGDYLPKGYYVFCPPVAEQDQGEREARKSVVVRIAAKLKGAVHFFDLAIDVNR